jgi:hypothetical protein
MFKLCDHTEATGKCILKFVTSLCPACSFPDWMKMDLTHSSLASPSFVNIIRKFRKAVQMCEPPYIQDGHGTRFSLNRYCPAKIGRCGIPNFVTCKKTRIFGVPYRICRNTGTVPVKSRRMESLGILCVCHWSVS